MQQDDRIASEYFWRAGSRGNPEGQYQYAVMLRDGRGVKRDKEKAIEWFEKAAEKSYKDAAQQVKSLKSVSPAKRTHNTSKHSKR